MRVRFLLAAMFAGAVAVLGFAPFQLFPLPVVSLAVLFGLLAHRQRAGDGFVLGLAWGLGFFVAGISWLYVALNRFGGMPGAIAALCIFLFAAYLALWPAIASELFVRFKGRRVWRNALLAAGLWMLAEWLRGWLLTGFPWLSIGYSQTPPSPLAGFFPLLGVFGVSGIVVMIAAGLGMMAPRGAHRMMPWTLATLIVLGSGYGLRGITWTQPAGETLSVALVQTNIEQDLKWERGRLRQWLDLNDQFVRSAEARLVVLPESTLPVLSELLPEGYLAKMSGGLSARGSDAIVGVFMRDAEGRIYNAALSLGASETQRYAKQHLVPFGEYSPPTFDWFYRVANIPMSDQTSGGPNQAPMRFDDQRLALNICYEDAFGNEIRSRAEEATILVNLSNLAWYGDSFAQPQHLQIARVRAMETGRPMLRATNTGMTAAIGPQGELIGVLPPFTRGVLEVSVQGMRGQTPYLRWGDGMALGWALAALLPALMRRRSN